MGKKKIAFIATGGTIACVTGPDGMCPAFTEKKCLILCQTFRYGRNQGI